MNMNNTKPSIIIIIIITPIPIHNCEATRIMGRVRGVRVCISPVMHASMRAWRGQAPAVAATKENTPFSRADLLGSRAVGVLLGFWVRGGRPPVCMLSSRELPLPLHMILLLPPLMVAHRWLQRVVGVGWVLRAGMQAGLPRRRCAMMRAVESPVIVAVRMLLQVLAAARCYCSHAACPCKTYGGGVSPPHSNCLQHASYPLGHCRHCSFEWRRVGWGAFCPCPPDLGSPHSPAHRQHRSVL